MNKPRKSQYKIQFKDTEFTCSPPIKFYQEKLTIKEFYLQAPYRTYHVRRIDKNYQRQLGEHLFYHNPNSKYKFIAKLHHLEIKHEI